jgi:hypothetical protein
MGAESAQLLSCKSSIEIEADDLETTMSHSLT